MSWDSEGWDHMDIAAFIMLGDAELTVAAATELLKKIRWKIQRN